MDSDKLSLALLQYLNTPLRRVIKSPAQMTTGRHMRDGVSTTREKYKLDPQWQQTLHERELEMARDHEVVQQQCAGQPRRRHRLQPGARVWIQDQATKTWSKSGTVVDVHPYRQYAVRIDGSVRISLHNRGHQGGIITTGTS